ncbi:hypothetical protein ACN26Y_09040 [Micromonospora sp. WMMD558]|uniref:hypothetical protein n=1 Tax=unclassified Micromonospora TaxID=2617518 RepID=UPI0012B466A2|nr:hypothetical protein [Micromonospora sp. WMMC415]QGN46416.1 hypothetical protein GKC29_05960 [Micromonospora sp. WMMC415]
MSVQEREDMSGKNGRRRIIAVVAAGAFLVPPLSPGAAYADEGRPVDVTTEEVVLAEAAEIEAGTVPGNGWIFEDEPARPGFGCPEAGTHYRVFNRKGIHIPVGMTFKNGPGGTTKAAIQTGLEATVKVSASASFSAGALVAKAETTFGIEASVTSKIQHTWEYSRNIDPKKYGNLRFGNWGWRMGAEKYTVDSRCKVKNKKSATVTAMPSASTWGYRYWETSS